MAFSLSLSLSNGFRNSLRRVDRAGGGGKGAKAGVEIEGEGAEVGGAEGAAVQAEPFS